MATKVHDQGDHEFAEIDVILAQAKQEARRERKLRRNLNLSDIPENFALLVPLSEFPSCTQRPVSLDTTQVDCASNWDRAANINSNSNSRNERAKPPKLHVLGMKASIKWMRAYMSCLSTGSPSTSASHPAAKPHS